MSSKWSSRKFWTMIVSVGLFTGLLVGGYVQPEVYAQLMTISIGGYFLGNAAEKFAK